MTSLKYLTEGNIRNSPTNGEDYGFCRKLE